MVECSLHKLEDPGSNPQRPCTIPGAVACAGIISAEVAGGALLSTGQPAKVTPGFDNWALHTHAAQCHTYTHTHTHTQIARIVHRTLSHTLNVLLGIFFVILELALLASSGFGRSTGAWAPAAM